MARHLRDEPEEGEENLACVRANVVIQQSSNLVEANQASVLHHEVFLRIREEHDVEVQSLTEKSDSYKLLSEKLRADLTAAREEHEEMAEQVDALLAEAEEFKKCMNILASKKEAVEAQLELSYAQLRSAKENALGMIEKMKELQHRLDLATSDKADLAKELEVARSEVIEANKRADAKVPQFRINVEVNKPKLRAWSNMKNGKLGERLSRRSELRASILGPRLKSPGRRRTKLGGWTLLRRIPMTRGSLKMRTMPRIRPPIKIESFRALGRLLRSFDTAFSFCIKNLLLAE
ncbi:uncharacterized protein [Nicotiana tomentosiformis]|uniref:uncharacterized protein n=1 Tax=Nicotiana tomentosiformis TaxID=4098 RepID=UPI00388C3FEE